MDDKKLTKLMIELKYGSMDSLAEIYNCMYKNVYSFIYPILKDSSKCEDILQNTFIQVYQKREAFDESQSARNWILTISKNLAINEINKNKKEIQIDFDQNPNIVSYNEVYQETPLLDLAAKTLSKDEYQVLYMHIVGEMKHKEIAKVLNIPLGTVTWLYKKAIDKLKNEIKSKGGTI